MSEKKKPSKNTGKVFPKKDKGHKTGGIMAAYKKVLQHIASFTGIVDELRVNTVKGKGISTRAVDPAHVVMRELQIKEGPKLLIVNDYELGLDLDRLKSIIPYMPDDEIAVGFKDYGKWVTFSYDHHRPEHKVADLMGMSDPKLPTHTLPGCYHVNIEALIASIRHIEQISSHVKFFINDAGFKVQGLGEKDNYTGKFPGTCEDWDESKGSDTLTSIYSLDYIDTILTTYKKLKFEHVWIQMGQDYPGIFEVEVNEGDYQFYDRTILAPRIENE